MAGLRIGALAVLAVLSLGACARAAPPAAAAAAAAFLAKNSAEPGTHVTATGLQYRVLRSGPQTGPHPRESDEVKVNYEGKLLDGTVFDSSFQRGAPDVMAVGRLIPAWTEALQLMRPGDEWRLYVPAGLGYGDKGAGPIPPGAVMVFRLELIAIEPGAGG
ncbi:MAG: FKBP-type peptidyl-prolyl cis-trans isomerase [Caulobacteraceae bacterium]